MADNATGDKPGAAYTLPEVVVSGPPADHRVSRTCDQEKAEMQALTDTATSKQNPQARNKDITAAYKALAAKCPDNRWITLGSYVSAQAGCAMGTLSGFQANTVGRAFFNPGQAVNGLGAVNKAIFSGIYPYAAFACKYGVDRLLECYGKDLPAKLQKAFNSLKNGDKKGAAQQIADYEQRDVVASTYSQYASTFAGVESAREFATGMGMSDPGSISLSYDCGAQPTIPFNGSITNTDDRLNYYGALYGAAYGNN